MTLVLKPILKNIGIQEPLPSSRMPSFQVVALLSAIVIGRKPVKNLNIFLPDQDVSSVASIFFYGIDCLQRYSRTLLDGQEINDINAAKIN